MRSGRPGATVAVVLALAAACLAGCGKSEAKPPATSPPATLGARPSSPAKLAILSPRNGQKVRGGAITLRLRLDNARIVNVTSTRVRPDQGHVHVLVDGRLVAMNYRLTGQLPALPPGQHVVRVDFVGSDHLPFDPQVSTRSAFQVER